MLFNSWVFVLIFLPSVLGVYWFLANSGRRDLLVLWLILASLAFYGWWEPRYVFLIVGSVLFNYFCGLRIHQVPDARGWLILGVAGNLLLLGYYKYAEFFVRNVADLTGLEFGITHIVLPIGISFFTFQQIAYLVDVRRGATKPGRFTEYMLFVSFFPQLIAGPIVHHRDLAPQLARLENLRAAWIAPGLTLFSLGLMKKVGIADGIEPYASQLFDEAAGTGIPSFVEAWRGAIAYAFQLYFDFSGYAE